MYRLALSSEKFSQATRAKLTRAPTIFVAPLEFLATGDLSVLRTMWYILYSNRTQVSFGIWSTVKYQGPFLRGASTLSKTC